MYKNIHFKGVGGLLVTIIKRDLSAHAYDNYQLGNMGATERHGNNELGGVRLRTSLRVTCLNTFTLKFRSINFQFKIKASSYEGVVYFRLFTYNTYDGFY